MQPKMRSCTRQATLYTPTSPQRLWSTSFYEYHYFTWPMMTHIHVCVHTLFQYYSLVPSHPGSHSHSYPTHTLTSIPSPLTSPLCTTPLPLPPHPPLPSPLPFPPPPSPFCTTTPPLPPHFPTLHYTTPSSLPPLPSSPCT